MWKDFFYYSKNERRAIISLTSVIIIVQIALWTTDYWLPLLPDELTNISANQRALSDFQDSLTLQKGFGKNATYGSYGNPDRKYSKSVIPVNLTAFDPNAADSLKLISLGLRPYVAKNVLQYRRKGGTFHKAEDFSRIYGMDQAQYVRLKPFIRIHTGVSEKIYPSNYIGENQINTQKTASLTTSQGGQPEVSTSASSRFLSVKSSESRVLEINRVDTTILQQLKGIGAVTANRVVQYRSRLGGFYSAHQLEEIKGLYPEALTRLQSLLVVDTNQIVRINANNASLEKLKSHPYISFYQAKVIVELRKARSGIRSIDELAEFKEFTSVDIDRLKWYLSF